MAWKKQVTPKDADNVSAKKAEMIKEQLDELKELVHKAFETRRRFWSYTALEGAYALYLEWKEDGNPKKNAKAAAALFGVKRKNGDRALSTIIKIVTPKGVDARDWVKALRYALRQGVAAKDFIAFFKANGGPRGCARKFRTKK